MRLGIIEAVESRWIMIHAKRQILKSKQEYQLKAKHFLPPVHYAPELFLLEATPDIREALAISDRSSNQSPNSVNRGSPRSYRDGYRTYRDRNGYQSDPRPTDRSRQRAPDRASPMRRYSPLPRINPTSPSHSREASPDMNDNGLDRQPFSESQDSLDARNNFNRSKQKYEDGTDDEAYSPSHARAAYKESPQASPRREPERAYAQNQRTPPDPYRKDAHTYRKDTHTYREDNRTYRKDEKSDPYHKDRDSDPQTVHPLDHSPQHSREASPIRRGAPGVSHRGANGYEQRDAAYTTNTNEDSGVAGMTPEDQYKNRDKENFYDSLNSKTRDMHNRLDRDRFNADDDDDERRRLQEMEDRERMDRERWESEQEERRRRAEEDQHRSEEEKKREESRRWAEEEARKRAQEEEDERKRREEAARLKGSNEDLSRFPSPPPLRMSSAEYGARDTESARQRRREEKKKLLEELEEAKEVRRSTEKEREELVRKAKTLQNKTQNRPRDVWKKRYFEEKKKTPPLEEQTNRLREELEALHRKLMTTLEGPKEKNVKISGDVRPSQRNNYVIQCTKLQHDIDDLRRRVENAKMKLTAEMKLRNQAEAELRALRAELTQKKINLSLTRSQHFAALSPGMPNGTMAAPVPSIPHGKGEPQTAHS
ncbi:hypothetical protein BaRGS_00018263 [Batillaria attramentaria]|uniref:Spermatogenesis-associated protein 1 C-terminal domain-containing protein n=1 Tax=Batillaria attramentaria TaxID=370345 RepID=A0ABD0KTS9_9CAEN